MVRNEVKKVVKFTACTVKKTAEKVHEELKRLHDAGVLSREDVDKLLSLVSHEAQSGKQRLMRFVKSELKHDFSLARDLGKQVVARTKKVSKVLASKKKIVKKKGKRKK